MSLSQFLYSNVEEGRILTWKKMSSEIPRRHSEPLIRYMRLVKAFRPQTVSLMKPSGLEPDPHRHAESADEAVMKKVDINSFIIPL